jgi:hypothetical protein
MHNFKIIFYNNFNKNYIVHIILYDFRFFKQGFNMMTNILYTLALMLELENARSGPNTSITCEFIFTLNSKIYKSKSLSMKCWFRA